MVQRKSFRLRSCRASQPIRLPRLKIHPGPAVELGSSRAPADPVPTTTTTPTRPGSSRQHAGGGGGVVGAATTTTTPLRTNSRQGRGNSPTHPGSHDAAPAGGGVTRDAHATGPGGRRQKLRNATPEENGAAKDEEHDGAAAPFPAFDELSRWKVTRGSVPRMVRLAGEVSEKAFIEDQYRRVQLLHQKKQSSFLGATARIARTVDIRSKHAVNFVIVPRRYSSGALLLVPNVCAAVPSFIRPSAWRCPTWLWPRDTGAPWPSICRRKWRRHFPPPTPTLWLPWPSTRPSPHQDPRQLLLLLVLVLPLLQTEKRPPSGKGAEGR